jgi:hypothetical protein
MATAIETVATPMVTAIETVATATPTTTAPLPSALQFRIVQYAMDTQMHPSDQHNLFSPLTTTSKSNTDLSTLHLLFHFTMLAKHLNHPPSELHHRIHHVIETSALTRNKVEQTVLENARCWILQAHACLLLASLPDLDDDTVLSAFDSALDAFRSAEGVLRDVDGVDEDRASVARYLATLAPAMDE